MNVHLILTISLSTLLASTLIGLSAVLVSADTREPSIKSYSVTSEFPNGFRINVAATGDNITSVAVRLRIGQQTRGVYDYLCQDKPGQECEKNSESEITEVKSELFWRTNSLPRYIPPGTSISYVFEIENSNGNRFETTPDQFIYHDARFDWDEVSEGPISVAYHGPVKSRAQSVLESIIDTLEVMGPLLGAGIEKPIRVTMYNNVKEMLEALPPGSSTIRRELVTEGQAFTQVGTLLVLGGGRLAKGTASHEVTHILVHRAGDSVFRSVPAWLNEGLAEYGNTDPSFTYDIALEFAVASDRIMPVMFQQGLPGDPEDVIIFYGQGRSIVRLMINVFGPEKMTRLMANLKKGKNMDDSLTEVYGLDRLALDAIWRESIGAPAYVPPESGRLIPTPLPMPKILPYSLTPHPQSEPITDTLVDPTPTVISEPREESKTVTKENSTTSPTTNQEAGSTDYPETSSPAGTSCAVPFYTNSNKLDLTASTAFLGLIGLRLRRRLKR